MIFETYEHDGNPWVHFCLFGETYQFDFPHFSELMDFSRNCLSESQATRKFNHLDFCNDISGKTAGIRIIDIQNPGLRFLHRWLSFTLFLMQELHSVTVVELKCFFAMVHRIKYTPVADIVDYFKEIRTLSGPIECTSLVTRIALNIGCPEMHNVSYIKGDVPILVFLTLYTPMFCVKSPIILFLCCMREATRCFGYPTKHTCCVPLIN
jgi:hypothetical protein